MIRIMISSFSFVMVAINAHIEMTAQSAEKGQPEPNATDNMAFSTAMSITPSLATTAPRP